MKNKIVETPRKNLVRRQIIVHLSAFGRRARERSRLWRMSLNTATSYFENVHALESDN